MKQLSTLSLLLVAVALSPTAQAQDVTNNGGVITLTGGAILSVSGSLTTSGTLDLSAGANSVLVGGNFVNASGATLTPGTASTVTLNGAALQQLDLHGATLANLTINNAGGTSGGVQLPAGSNTNVTGVLTLANGLVTTAPTSTLTLTDGATMTGQRGSAPIRYVVGNLAAIKATVSGATTFPNDFGLNPHTALTNLTVTRTAGLRTAQVSYGTNSSGANKGIDQIWQTSAPLTNATVSFTWLADNDNGLANLATAQVWARTQAPVANADWAAVSIRQDASSTRTVASTLPASTSYSFFTASTAEAPLPVTLAAFAAQSRGADGLVTWTTASEVDNAYFQIESSVDGTAFQLLGRVAGAGTSSQAHSYQYTDSNLARYGAPVVYYRLRQVDAAGTATYSVVRTVSVAAPAGWLAQVYPNPSTALVPVSIALHTEQNGEVQFTLTDAMGQLVSRQTTWLAAGTATCLLAVPTGLAAGVYVLQVRQGAQQQTLKLVRQ